MEKKKVEHPEIAVEVKRPEVEEAEYNISEHSENYFLLKLMKRAVREVMDERDGEAARGKPPKRK